MHVIGTHGALLCSESAQPSQSLSSHLCSPLPSPYLICYPRIPHHLHLYLLHTADSCSGQMGNEEETTMSRMQNSS